MVVNILIKGKLKILDFRFFLIKPETGKTLPSYTRRTGNVSSCNTNCPNQEQRSLYIARMSPWKFKEAIWLRIDRNLLDPKNLEFITLIKNNRVVESKNTFWNKNTLNPWISALGHYDDSAM